VQITGYFQHEAYVPAGFADRLRLPQPTAARPQVAFVHVRRGDYVNHPRFELNLLENGYYHRAMDHLRAQHANAPTLRFLVFSNDMAWTREQPLFRDSPDVDFYQEPLPTAAGAELQTLNDMASCEAGGVGANSAFSWWAAFLSSRRHSLAAFTFPDPWYNDDDSLVTDTPFHGAWLLPVRHDGGPPVRVNRTGAAWSDV
jgi:hypothetical protein